MSKKLFYFTFFIAILAITVALCSGLGADAYAQSAPSATPSSTGASDKSPVGQVVDNVQAYISQIDPDTTPWLRGINLLVLQPYLIAGLILFGIFCDQMANRLRDIWTLPVVLVGVAWLSGYILCRGGGGDCTTLSLALNIDDDGQWVNFIPDLSFAPDVNALILCVFGGLVSMRRGIWPIVAYLLILLAGTGMANAQLHTAGTAGQVGFWVGFSAVGFILSVAGYAIHRLLLRFNFVGMGQLLGWAGMITGFLALIHVI